MSVCVLTLLHTTHKYHHISKEQQQEESFQVIGQMRRITSSVWLTHGPRPFRKSRHVLEPWVIGRSLAHHHSLSVASFVFIFGLLLSSPWWWYRSAPFWFFCSRILICKRMNYTITHTSLDRPWSNIILKYTSTLQKYKRCVLNIMLWETRFKIRSL